MTTLQLHLLDTGYCTARENHMVAGASTRTVECHALVGLLRHPHHGWLLWDTGYSPHMLAASERWPYRAYRIATPLHIQPEQSVLAQLARFGLAPQQIERIVISHFHADHVAGLLDFPQAQVIASGAAYASVAGKHGLRALRRASLPELLPADLGQRLQAVDTFDGPALPGLGPTHDLFGDGSALLVALPGHARGQLGMLIQSQHGPVLLAADGAWHSRNIRENQPPGLVTAPLADDWGAVRRTIANLHSFAQQRPDVQIIPTHCPEIHAAYCAGIARL